MVLFPIVSASGHYKLFMHSFIVPVRVFSGALLTTRTFRAKQCSPKVVIAKKRLSLKTEDYDRGGEKGGPQALMS